MTAPSTALLTDHYELTMVEAALRNGTGHRRAVFETFARRLPEGRRYGVVAGTGRLLDAIERFRFDAESLELLDRAGVVDRPTLDWLADYRFRGNVWGYGEGDCFFPGSPVLVVESSFAEAVLLETLTLSVLNHDSAVAAAASRMTMAAGDRPCVEMGSRRTHERAAVAAARAAYIAGFANTSNLQARREYGIPTTGTSAHAFTLVHDSERDAFTAQVDSLGAGTTLLVDTYDVAMGVRTAVEVARQGRDQLDELGAAKTRIVVTSDLDEFQIAALAAAPVDAYGVGTALVTGSGAPTAGMVYKLVARSVSDAPYAPLLPVAKRSLAKAGLGGRKWAVRELDSTGTATAETIGTTAAPPDRPAQGGGYRELLRPLIRAGEVVGRESLTAARDRHYAALQELPATAHQLSRGEPAIPTRYVEGPDDPRSDRR